MIIAGQPAPRRDPGIPPETQLREALEANGQRLTDQRAAVYRFLVSTETHPTAEEVFTAVRAEIADISLATVYKALELLVGCGLAARLSGGRQSRYDGRMDPHHHARCVECGAVLDVSGRLDRAALDLLGPVSGFQVEGYRLELVGCCTGCLPG